MHKKKLKVYKHCFIKKRNKYKFHEHILFLVHDPQTIIFFKSRFKTSYSK